MSDARDQSANTVVSEVAPNNPGGWLKQERERQGVTAQRIATDMHLSVTAIEAIEANRFAVLGAPVFAKGHLRKYASLLNLPPDRVAELYDRLEDAPRQVDPIPLTQRAPEPALRAGIREMLSTSPDSRQRPTSSGVWIAAIVVLVVAVAIVGWWYLGRRSAVTESPQVDTSSAEPSSLSDTRDAAQRRGDANQSESKTPSPVTAAVPNQSQGPSPSVSQPAVTPPAPRVTRSAGSPPPGKVRVRLTFARESWVEVYDAGGNRMLYDVGRADLPRMIDVEPPALVVLGDATAVTTEANDKVVAVPPKNISGTVARFTIMADGTLK
jgi:cytoskeleton protein RodZ